MRVITIWLAVGSFLAAVAHFGHGWSFGCVLLLVVLGLPLGGLLITLDDDLPGGFSNPDGKVAPPWHFREFWGEILARASLGIAGFAVDFGWSTQAAISIGVGVVGAVTGRFLMQQNQSKES